MKSKIMMLKIPKIYEINNKRGKKKKGKETKRKLINQRIVNGNE